MSSGPWRPPTRAPYPTLTSSARRSAEHDRTVSLIRRFQGGDPVALDTLFSRYYPRVLRYVQLRMGPLVKSRFEAEDIVQEVFAAAMQDLHSVVVSEPGELIHRLATVAENQIRGKADYLAAKNLDARIEKSLDSIRGAISTGSFRFDPADDGTPQMEELARKELVAIVNECIGDLSPDHREVILLRNVAGCSWALVAEKMGRETDQAVCMLHARARVALLKLLAPRLRDVREGEMEA
ncbi:MAG: sigma-70 family RNA polymerase sigma factor [Planctomycetes bacterium]|nr:sigma-70 family RNA polymerase sigma factor [Planctomycetota bacterium]